MTVTMKVVPTAEPQVIARSLPGDGVMVHQAQQHEDPAMFTEVSREILEVR